MSEASKSTSYDPKAIEAEIYQLWISNHCFRADPSDKGDPYSIVIPPPNVTGALHLGHAINNTLQDILTRVHRMRGRNVLWVPGIDHAGIATQAMVEKQLKEKENKTRHDVGRDGLVERIWAWKKQYGDRILQQLERLGCSCDWSRTRFTLDDLCARAVRETFFKLFKDGLIYRGKRLVNWDVHLQTSISDDEIYHEPVKTSLWHIRYPIEGVDKFMVVATTRPETMLGDTAVAVHSEDPRWNWAIGKQVRLPLTHRLIPIIADDILVDPKFGSGVVKVTPAHDPNDYAVWQRHQNHADKIEILNILNSDGTLNENAGAYARMKRDAARKKVVEDLEAAGLMEKIEPYETQVGHSDRSKTPVEPYLSDQWFVKMAPLAEPALEVVRDGTIKFYPERHAQQYLSWLGEKRDWPISRQLWWGHRIPVWTVYTSDGAASSAASKFQKLFKMLDLESDVSIIAWSGDNNQVQICSRTRAADNSLHSFNFGFNIPTASNEAREFAHGLFKELNSPPVIQDNDVLDTWFSSALWPHSTLGWPDETADLEKWYPTSVLCTDRSIITLWVARMVMMGLYNMKEIPFHHVVINPTVLDGKGERMSKSKGNGVDPVDVIETHGADALRFTLTMMATETQDVRMPVKRDAEGRNTSDKFDIGRNFCNKLWNAARFVMSAKSGSTPKKPDRDEWSLADKWIMSRLMRTIGEIDESLGSYRFDVYARACYDFFWRDVCDWYLEINKLALRDPARKNAVVGILFDVLDQSLRLLHPMIPFITETLWRRMHGTEHFLIKAEWPTLDKPLISEPDEQAFTQLQEIVTAIRNLRSQYKVDLKQVVEVSLSVPANSAQTISSNRDMIESLAMCRVNIGSPPEQGAVRAAVGGCEIFVAALADSAAEKNRLQKLESDLKQKIQSMQGRLANESYRAKAPPKLVKETEDQFAQAQIELAKVQDELRKYRDGA